MMTLSSRIDAYLRRSGLTATRFGRDVARDPRLVFDIRSGREPRPPLLARIERELSSGRKG